MRIWLLCERYFNEITSRIPFTITLCSFPFVFPPSFSSASSHRKKIEGDSRLRIYHKEMDLTKNLKGFSSSAHFHFVFSLSSSCVCHFLIGLIHFCASTMLKIPSSIASYYYIYEHHVSIAKKRFFSKGFLQHIDFIFESCFFVYRLKLIRIILMIARLSGLEHFLKIAKRPLGIQ